MKDYVKKKLQKYPNRYFAVSTNIFNNKSDVNIYIEDVHYSLDGRLVFLVSIETKLKGKDILSKIEEIEKHINPDSYLVCDYVDTYSFCGSSLNLGEEKLVIFEVKEQK